MRALLIGILLLIARPFIWYGSALAYHFWSERSYRFRVTVMTTASDDLIMSRNAKGEGR